VFAKLRKTTTSSFPSICLSVCPSVRIEQLGCHSRIYMVVYIWVLFLYISRIHCHSCSMLHCFFVSKKWFLLSFQTEDRVFMYGVGIQYDQPKGDVQPPFKLLLTAGYEVYSCFVWRFKPSDIWRHAYMMSHPIRYLS